MSTLKLIISTLLLCTVLQNNYGQVNYNGQEANIPGENGRKSGLWVFYGKDKNIKGYQPEDIYEVGVFVDGRKDSVWKRFYPSGNLMSEITYKGGRPNGPFTTYHDKEGMRGSDVLT